MVVEQRRANEQRPRVEPSRVVSVDRVSKLASRAVVVEERGGGGRGGGGGSWRSGGDNTRAGEA